MAASDQTLQAACPSISRTHFDDCGPDSNDFLDKASVQLCYEDNCRGYCVANDARRLQTAKSAGSDVDISNWCMCLGYNSYDILDMFDSNGDEGLSWDEFELMFDADTDFFLIDWPVLTSAEVHFRECDEDGERRLMSYHAEYCYDKNCDFYCRPETQGGDARRAL